ncbi:hypothetical protein MPSEU_000405300 [Mayamaea pseudoterrestris]|nr:hypothetical protein MPSEU_000405300 [Mayamaea pseudoterrestris]
MAPRLELRRRCSLSTGTLLLLSLGLPWRSKSFQQPSQPLQRRRIRSLSTLNVHMFDPFQGASRYVASEEVDDAETDDSVGVAASNKAVTTSSNGATDRSHGSNRSWSHGAASSSSSHSGSVYIGGANETTASSHGLERSNLINADAISNLGSAVAGGGSNGSMLSNEATSRKSYASEAVKSGDKAANLQVLGSVPSMRDLYNRIGLLQREIKARNAEVQGTVTKLSNATVKVASRLQSSTENVHQIVSELKLKAEAAQKDVRLKDEAVQRVQREFDRLEESTSAKLRLLTEQLQDQKFKSHESQVAAQQKANDEQAKLRTSIKILEEKLAQQANATTIQTQRADEYLQERLAVERELKTTKEALQASVSDLETRLSQLKVKHEKEQSQFEKTRQEELQSLRNDLEKVVREANESKTSLENELKAKDSEHKQFMQQLHTQSAEKEKTMNEKLQHFANELQRVMSESQERLAAETEKTVSERQKLLDEIQKKEEELKNESAKVSNLDSKISDYDNKTRKLESTLSTLKTEHEQLLADTKKRVEELKQTHLGERNELESKLFLAKDEASRLTEKNIELTRDIEDLEQKLKQQQERSRTLLEEARFATAQVTDELQFQIKAAQNELTEQIKLNEEMKEREQKHFVRIADLGGELSALKNKFARELALWESRYKSMHEAQSAERVVANTTLAQITREAATNYSRAVQEAKQQQATLEQQLLAKDSAIIDLKAQQNMTVQELNAKIESAKTDLNRTKLEAETTLATEQREAAEKLSSLQCQIDAKEALVVELSHVKRKLETENQKQVATRIKLEEELALMKTRYAQEVRRSAERIDTLRGDLTKQVEDHRRTIAKREAEMELAVQRHTQEIERQKDLASKDLATKDSEHRQVLQQLQQSSAQKQTELMDQIQLLNNTLAHLRNETESRLTLAAEASLAQQHDLRYQILRKEEEVRAHLRTIHQSNIAVEQARARQRSTHDEFLALKSKYKSLKAEWEGKYEALEDNRRKEQQDFQSETTRREAEAQTKVDSTLEHLRGKEAEFMRCLKSMDRDYRQKLSDLHQQYQNREKDLASRIEVEKTKLEEAMKSAESALKSERLMFQEKEIALQTALDEKVEAVRLTSQTLKDLRDKQTTQEELVQRLEKDLGRLKAEHASAIDQWTERCKVLEEKAQAMQVVHQAELHKKDEEVKRAVNDAQAKVERIRVNTELATKARDAIYDQKVTNMQASLKAAELELEGRVGQLQMSDSEAKQKHAELLEKFKEKEKELNDQLAQTKEQMAEGVKLRQAQSDLEAMLKSLTKEQETTIADWISKYNLLEDSLANVQQANAEALSRKESEWKGRMDAAVAAFAEEKRVLETALSHKAKLLSQNAISLKEASLQKEKDLKSRLQAITDEFQRYKFSSHQALMEAQRQAKASTADTAIHDEAKTDSSSLEHIRFDLSKLLVKKEVEIMRKQADGETHQSSSSEQQQVPRKRKKPDREKPKPLIKQKRKSIRERLAAIFFRSPDESSSTSRQANADKELSYRR